MDLHRPWAHQQVSLELTDEFDVIGQSGGRGSAKSDTIDQFIMREAWNWPSNQVRVFRRKQDDANTEDFDHFLNTWPKEFIANTGNEGQAKYALVKPYQWDGKPEHLSRIVFRGVISEGKQNPDNAKGEFGAVAFPELSEIDQNVFLQACTSCRKPDSSRKVMCAYNRVDRYHWIWTYFPMSEEDAAHSFYICQTEGCPEYKRKVTADHSCPNVERRPVYKGGFPGHITVWSKTTDNGSLPKDYIDKRFANMPAAWVAKYIEGRSGFEPDGHGVYEQDYKANVHSQMVEPIPDAPILRAFDPGLYPAILWAQMVKVDGRPQLRVLLECAGFNVQYSEFLLTAFGRQNELFGTNRIYLDCGDPALRAESPQTKRSSLDILGDYGINLNQFRICDDAVRNSKSYRVDTVKQWLLTNGDYSQIAAHPKRCPILTEGFEGGYKWRWNQTVGKLVQEPVKDFYYSGVHDCLQYLLTNFGDIHGATINQNQDKLRAHFKGRGFEDKQTIPKRRVVAGRGWAQ